MHGLRLIAPRTCASSLTLAPRWRRSMDMPTRAGSSPHSIAICASLQQAIFNSLSTRCQSAYRCPAVYCEIIKHAVGTSSANEMTLFGQVYDLSAAQRMGVVNRIVPSECLIDEAVAWAGAVEPGCHPAYAFTKRALQGATLRTIDDARRLDLDLLASRITDPGSLRAHARRYRELKGRDPTWEISS
jgi:hypothetical protein